MTRVTTHVLDTARGVPAEGVAVRLEAAASDGGWRPVGEGRTDADGRVGDLGEGTGVHRLVFAAGDYLAAHGVERPFFPEITVTFVLGGSGHCHVPLLLGPFSYATYRGS
jgi:5-hydroxyisourate hydrolase